MQPCAKSASRFESVFGCVRATSSSHPLDELFRWMRSRCERMALQREASHLVYAAGAGSLFLALHDRPNLPHVQHKAVQERVARDGRRIIQHLDRCAEAINMDTPAHW